MRRENRPDGIVSSAGAATLAIVAGIEDAGLTVGRDVDIVSKQSSKLLHLFRPAHPRRQRGFPLGRPRAGPLACSGWIDGGDPATLQSLSVPTAVESYAAAEDDQATGSRKPA